MPGILYQNRIDTNPACLATVYPKLVYGAGRVDERKIEGVGIREAVTETGLSMHQLRYLDDEGRPRQ